MEAKEGENRISTCCGTVSDKRLLVFVSSITISSMTLAFSFYQLSKGLDCQSENLYVGFVSLIIGYWCRSPLQ